MAYDYAIYDVFTDTPLSGNPLAVVFDADGLDDEAMQKVAGEFNLSETIFFKSAEEPAHGAAARIFTPRRELPFAGHPTVGGAVALAERTNGEPSQTLDVVQVIEERVGPVRCAVHLEKGTAGFCEFDLPRLSSRQPAELGRGAVAAALSLGPHEIGFENHTIGCWSAGVPFVLVPVHDIGAVERAACDPAAWRAVAPSFGGHPAAAYVYCSGGVRHDASYHCRMFASDMGIVEDPATGSAAAALSGAIHECDGLLDGHHTRLIEQGFEIGRPSLIHLHIETAGNAISRARIGGQAVKVAEGRIRI